ncbi:MAG: flavodoxin-dependent (E)-4-hydroxy-3-methylbut-2-enyl-diphosphate synthase [Clostridia bacterium]|nr:flavodoxin-dependent (E)-4-hydroxy-3-methylbut-2-enyl-diphosphate synthase [Clostridia bacterium]MBR5769197.1 flavodoxin-dependent (E)-4-hydroxy-3-methylbut-2-enyl-diphosphate synthase [Clostridia bacterium]
MTRKVRVGNTYIGGGAPVSVQTMLDAPSYDVEGNVAQAIAVEEAGCDILRVAVPDEAALAALEAVKKAVSVPVVADIHFDYKLALAAIDCGADKIRINPGNIGGAERVRAVTEKCKTNGVAIRVGVNSGSLEKEVLTKYGSPTPEALCESALNAVRLLESFDFYDTVVSIKTSSVVDTVSAYRLFSAASDYPLHIGVTEAGTEKSGTVRSAVALGSLLLDGIGDTLRVSLSASPLKEVEAGIAILKACGLRDGAQVISCPTCGRTRIDVKSLAEQAEALAARCEKPIKIAVMGCVVNGPGEAREADIGITGGDGVGLVFKKGEVVEKVAESELLAALEKYIKDYENANE